MNESPWDDLNIKALSDMEQAEAAQNNLAITLANFFNALVSNGLLREEALFLAAELLKHMFDMQKSQESDE